MIFLLVGIGKTCYLFIVMLKDILLILQKIHVMSGQRYCSLANLLGSKMNGVAYPSLSYEEGKFFMEAVKMGLIAYCHTSWEELVHWEEVYDDEMSDRGKQIGLSERGHELLDLYYLNKEGKLTRERKTP